MVTSHHLMSLKGTLTEKNLAMSFAGESMARNRYTFFADIAKKQGYEQIASLFLETADNEREHALYFFNRLKTGEGSIVVPVDVAISGVGDTLENLKHAAEGEFEEHSKAYPEFANIAEKEGFVDIARAFRKIAEVEKEHEERYRTLSRLVENKSVFKREKAMRWKCRNCGYVSTGLTAPKACPVCFKPQGWFEIKEIIE